MELVQECLCNLVLNLIFSTVFFLNVICPLFVWPNIISPNLSLSIELSGLYTLYDFTSYDSYSHFSGFFPISFHICSNCLNYYFCKIHCIDATLFPLKKIFFKFLFGLFPVLYYNFLFYVFFPTYFNLYKIIESIVHICILEKCVWLSSVNMLNVKVYTEIMLIAQNDLGFILPLKINQANRVSRHGKI